MSNEGVKKATRSRRVVSSDNTDEVKIYCRKCTESKKNTEFYSAVDHFLDSNNYFSLCKSCIGKIYVNFFKSESNLERAIYKTCKIIGLKFDTEAVDALKIQYESKGKVFGEESDFGIYKARLVSVQKSFGEKADNLDLTFREEIDLSNVSIPLDDDEFEEAKDLKAFWGNYSAEDLQFLETELSAWEENYPHENRAEITVLKEICYNELQKKLVRTGADKGSMAALVKQTNELLKVGGIQPNQAKAIDGNNRGLSLGMKIEDMEKTGPAMWLADEGHDVYHDLGNTDKYFQDHFVRPLKNFLLQTKDFNISDDETDTTSDGYDDLDIENEEDIINTESLSEENDLP